MLDVIGKETLHFKTLGNLLRSSLGLVRRTNQEIPTHTFLTLCAPLPGMGLGQVRVLRMLLKGHASCVNALEVIAAPGRARVTPGVTVALPPWERGRLARFNGGQVCEHSPMPGKGGGRSERLTPWLELFRRNRNA